MLQGVIDLSRELERMSRLQDKLTHSRDNVRAKLSDLIGKGKGHLPATHKLQEKVPVYDLSCCNTGAGSGAC